MNMKDALSIKSLKTAKLIAGENGLRNNVNGIMVLEAADIENWGREGEIILTSYFALKDMDAYELKEFLKKLSKIGTSAIIIKIDRLLLEIPEAMILYCNEYAIPLIQIPKEIKYEALMLEIMSPLIDENMDLLTRYYDAHNEMINLALKEPSILQILNELKRMIQMDVTFFHRESLAKIGTNPYYDSFQLIQSTRINKKRYMNFDYFMNKVHYTTLKNSQSYSHLSVLIPNLTHGTYELIIHEVDHSLKSSDFMVIENAVSFLQMELLKKYALSQNQFHRNNNLVTDLLHGRIYNQDEIDEVLELLHIKKELYYQVMQVQIKDYNQLRKKGSKWAENIIYSIRSEFKNVWKNCAFLEKEDRISFLYNLSDHDVPYTVDKVRELMDRILRDDTLPKFYYQASISTLSDKRSIPKINNEVLDIRKILHLFHKPNIILHYDDLGIYKILLASNNLEDMNRFISPTILAFKNDYPDLMDTLECFLNNNQNYANTAQKMYLHPKTIKYRIEKIQTILNFDFEDAEAILHAQIATRIFKLMVK